MSDSPSQRLLFHFFVYKKWAIPFAFISMALFHIPLWFNKKFSFYKLMGCGRNGTFDIYPDVKQWCILTVSTYREDVLQSSVQNLYGTFIANWIKLFTASHHALLAEPYIWHGKWDGRDLFGKVPAQKEKPKGAVVVLTRAQINWNRMRHFWSHVEGVAKHLQAQPGFLYSVGIGEVPWIKQATVSVWQSEEEMASFAYSQREHKTVIHKTRAEKWYKEDMFIRCKLISSLNIKALS